MSIARQALEGASILTTRPDGRGEELAAGIRRIGGRVANFPVIQVRLNATTNLLSPDGIPLSRYSLGIFVSVPAVQAVAAVLSAEREFPEDLPVAAIGPATARTLESFGIDVRYLPVDSPDSEGLLELLSNVALANCDVAVFRGQKGRELLEQSLAAWGARVHPVECYQREPVQNPPTDILSHWLAERTGILTLTSVEILDTFLKVMTAEQRALVYRRPVAVLSERIAMACRDRGFTGPVAVSEGVGPQAMLDTITRLHTRSTSPGS